MLKLKRFVFCSVLLLAGCTTVPDDVVEPLREDTFLYYTPDNGLLDYEVLSLFEDSEGNIWIGTYYGVNKYDGSNFETFTPFDDGIVTGGIVAIGQDFEGDIWVGSSDGYSILQDNTWTTELGIGITSFYLDQDDYFWVGTEIFGALQLSVTELEIYSDPNCDYCNFVTSFEEDSNGSLWFTSLGGAYKVTNKNTASAQQFTTDDGLSSNYLTEVINDQWGNLWFGAYYSEALSKYTINDFHLVSLPTSTESVITDFETGEDGLYIASDLGFLYYDGAVIREIKLPNEEYTINSLMKDKDGNLWIGTFTSGLIKYTPKNKVL